MSRTSKELNEPPVIKPRTTTEPVIVHTSDARSTALGGERTVAEPKAISRSTFEVPTVSTDTLHGGGRVAIVYSGPVVQPGFGPELAAQLEDTISAAPVL